MVTKNPALPHLIAVIDRNPNQLVSCFFPVDLPDRWNADAVICDPWDRAFYPAGEYDPYWASLRDVSDAPQKLACKVICQI